VCVTHVPFCLKPAVGSTRRQFFMALETTAFISDPMCRLHPTKSLAAILAVQFCRVDAGDTPV